MEFKPDKSKQKEVMEKRKTETIITAQTKEGKEIAFNLEKIREYWTDFYNDHGLPELAKALPETVNLTEEQIIQVKEKAKEGFDKFVLLPSSEIQQKHLVKINDETTKPLESLLPQQQYKETFFSDEVKSSFPDEIQILNRPIDKPYLLFVRELQEAPKETRGKSAEESREILKEKDETTLTLAEYFFLQRDYIERHKDENKDKPHLDASCCTWLLDSELEQISGGPDKAMYTGWCSGDQHIEVRMDSVDDLYPYRGIRFSIVLELETKNSKK